jgi:hypothetical protein
VDNKQLEELRVTLTAERDRLIQEANARIAYLNGKIEMLSELLAAPEEAAAARGDAG